MSRKKNVIGINGSASENSSNLLLLKFIGELGKSNFNFTILDDLSVYPPFRTELTDKNVPDKITEFRAQITAADGVIICTPEYVFSIPGRLKNIIEWSVSTTIFSDKPIGIVTASASGEKGHDELILLMETIQAKVSEDTNLLIKGVKGKVNKQSGIIDNNTKQDIVKFVNSFIDSL